MIPLYDDTCYCLIIDHNRFQDNALAPVFQHLEDPDICRLFDDTILASVAQEGPWCLFFDADCPLITDGLLEEWWADDPYWAGGSALVIAEPGADQAQLLKWCRSRALALSPAGSVSVFRFYSPAILNLIESDLPEADRDDFMTGMGEIIWSAGALNYTGMKEALTAINLGSQYQLSESFVKGLMG